MLARQDAKDLKLPAANSADRQELFARAAELLGSEVDAGLENSLAPADAQQAAQLMRFADERGISVEPRGSGTKNAWMGGKPADMRLSTRRMNALLEHTWQDMTCTAQAGCSWAALQARLAEHGQFVALDPLWPERATVGGVVAANDSGALRLRYGGLRDLLIGMTVVLADGTIAKSGGKVVKNVAGYDLPKLMCGSFGTLALITDVTFRLHSMPLHTVSVTVTSPAPEQLGHLMLQVMDRHFSSQSMQIRSGRAGMALDIRLMATPSVAAKQLDVLESLGATVTPSDDGVWRARQDIFDQHADGCLFKATSLATDIPMLAQRIADASGETVAQASGIAIGWLPVGSSQAVAEVRLFLESSGGSLTLLKRELPAGLDRWGKLPDSLPLMREVKRQFDPMATLNPGRFLGGI